MTPARTRTLLFLAIAIAPPGSLCTFAAAAETSAPALQTWTDGNLVEWWKTHPGPDTWEAGKEEIHAALRDAQLRNGTQRALENEHFVGWSVHLRWLDLLPDDPPPGSFFADEPARVVYRDLSLGKALPRLFVSSLAPEDDGVRALEILCTIAARYPKEIQRYPALAVALAVVFDQPFPEAWPHPFASRDQMLIGDLEADRRFAFYVQSAEEKRLLLDLRELSVRELTFLVDTLLKLNELAYAQQIQLKNPQHLAALFPVIPYDSARASGDDYSWPHKEYSLYEIGKKGGICMDQAFFVSQTGKAKGVPTILFLGQGRSGGHAWVGFLKARGEWELDMARIREEKYPVGTTYDPQTWRRLTDAQLRFIMADLMKTASYNRAQLALQWAAMNREAPFYREVLGYARLHASRSFATWDLEAAWLEENKLPPAEMEAFWKRWITNFRDETDMRIRGQIRLLRHFEEAGNAKEAERLRETMLKENQSERFDLAITIAAETILAAAEAGDWEAAEREFNAAGERFRKQAGGHLFYNLVEPFVERCMENGKTAVARNALRTFREHTEALPHTLLASDIEKLEKVVGGL